MRFAFSRWILTLAAVVGMTMAAGCKSGPSLAWFKNEAPSEEYAVQTTHGERIERPSTQFQPGQGSSPQYANNASTPYPDTRFSPNGPGGVQAGPYEDGRSPYSGSQVTGTGFAAAGPNTYRQSPPPSCAGCLSGYCAVHGSATPAAHPYGEGGVYTADQRNDFGGAAGYQSDSRGFGGSSGYQGGNSAPPTSTYPPASTYPPSSSISPNASQGSYDYSSGGTQKSYSPASSNYFGADTSTSSSRGAAQYQPNSTPPQLTPNDGDWAGPGSVRQANYDRTPMDNSYNSPQSGGGFGGGGSFGGTSQQPSAGQPW